MLNPSQLYLLADHVKLSLLERQRAISLSIEPTTQDGHIAKSLDQLRDGIDDIEEELQSLRAAGDTDRVAELQDAAVKLRSQSDELACQFQGFSHASPNPRTGSIDFSTPASYNTAKNHAPRRASHPFKRSTSSSTPTPLESVRFRDNEDIDDNRNRSALFPYRDDPHGEDTIDPSDLDNQQIHAYHRDVLQQQDDQLDRLGESIGRQRDLSMQIGDELDDHIQMLDDVEDHVDRHEGRLNGAKRQLDHVYRRSRENWGCTIISILVLVLVILIIALKS